jgi:hypothetical protein
VFSLDDAKDNLLFATLFYFVWDNAINLFMK